MWRTKVSLEKLRAVQWKDQEQAGKDIIQLYNRESKAERERQRKVVEIQRKARRKDESNRKLLELQGKAAEIRKNSQAKAGYNIVKLPPIESPIKPARRGLHKRGAVKDADVDEHFLPDIGVNNDSSVLNTRLTMRQSVDPSRDPRFQGLISCLLTSEEYFGDLQRFAPPRKEMSRHTRVGLGF